MYTKHSAFLVHKLSETRGCWGLAGCLVPLSSWRGHCEHYSGGKVVRMSFGPVLLTANIFVVPWHWRWFPVFFKHTGSGGAARIFYHPPALPWIIGGTNRTYIPPSTMRWNQRSWWSIWGMNLLDCHSLYWFLLHFFPDGSCSMRFRQFRWMCVKKKKKNFLLLCTTRFFFDVFSRFGFRLLHLCISYVSHLKIQKILLNELVTWDIINFEINI